MERIRTFLYQNRLLLALGFALLTALYLLASDNQPQSSQIQEWESFSSGIQTTTAETENPAGSAADSTAADPPQEAELMVDIKGAVEDPGVYKAEEGMRVLDIVEMAGGMTPKADARQINLAVKIADQMMIYIPSEGEDVTTIVSGEAQTEEEKIDLNTATLEQLMTLNGIGEKKASDIIRYREENGLFHSVEELTEVSGIGEKTLEGLKESLTVSEN